MSVWNEYFEFSREQRAKLLEARNEKSKINYGPSNKREFLNLAPGDKFSSVTLPQPLNTNIDAYFVDLPQVTSEQILNSGEVIIHYTTKSNKYSSKNFVTSVKREVRTIRLCNKGITSLDIPDSHSLSVSHLDLSHNKLESLPECVLRMPNLRRVCIKGNNIGLNVVRAASSFEIIH
jgi:hypothetical protein